MKWLNDYLLNLKEVLALKEVRTLPSRFCEFETVYDHTVEVMRYAQEKYPESHEMLIAAAFHDTGKVLTREIGKEGMIIFPKHADFSKTLAAPLLNHMINEKMIDQVAEDNALFLIEHHMRPMGNGEIWTVNAVRNLMDKIGPRLDMLLKFTDIDIRGRSRHETYDKWTKEIAIFKEGMKRKREEDNILRNKVAEKIKGDNRYGRSRKGDHSE
jgi:hypothetical protein